MGRTDEEEEEEEDEEGEASKLPLDATRRAG